MPQQNEKAQVQSSKWLIKYACLQTCLLYVLSKDEVGLKMQDTRFVSPRNRLAENCSFIFMVLQLWPEAIVQVVFSFCKSW